MHHAFDVLPDDGDGHRFCSRCAFSAACQAHGYNKLALSALHVLVEHSGPFPARAHLFREGDPFTAIAAVRAGTVKTYVVDDRGREHVLGFHIPGEIIGLSAIHRSRYPCNAVALDEVHLCRFRFARMAQLAAKLPALQRHLFDLLSEDIGKAALLAGDFSAEERVAAFFASLSQRYARQGFPATRLLLPMTRTDIANHLRLAPETVSRVLRRLRARGLLRVERRQVHLPDPRQLAALASSVLRGAALT
jgi:CRP/FNR family transcriptional regulator